LNPPVVTVTMRLAVTIRDVDRRSFTTPHGNRFTGPNGSLMDNASIRVRVRQMLETGALPCDEHGKVWAGRGMGTHCAACGEPIAAADVEFEVELRSGTAIRLHRVCHGIWREECDSLAPR
jgi:hypothetical protein